EEKGCWNQYIKGDDTLVFHFKDISLPGTKAEDVFDQDSTKGFIRFSVKTGKKLENKPFRASTEIFFDKNDPIKTNYATGRFRKSLSPILFGGYNGFISQPGYKEMTYKETGMLGIGLAPLAPYKKLFWQVEVYANWSQYRQFIYDVDDPGMLTVDLPDDRGDLWPTELFYDYYDRALESRNLNLRVVPLHIRYNFNRFIAVGAGALTQFRINLKSNEERIYKPLETMYEPIHEDYGRWKDGPGKDFGVKAFLDLTVGRVYMGPSIVLRYHYRGNNDQHAYLYAAWRISINSFLKNMVKACAFFVLFFIGCNEATKNEPFKTIEKIQQDDGITKEVEEEQVTEIERLIDITFDDPKQVVLQPDSFINQLKSIPN